MRTLCHDLSASTPGEEVVLEGWVHRRRPLSRVTFLVVRDRSGLAQVVLPAGTPVPPEETTVRVTGTATANVQAPGGMEVTAATVVALTEEAATPPVELWRPGLDVALPTLLDHAPVMWRHPAQRARWELAAASLRGFRSTLDGLGFTEVATPKVVGTATESGANVFPVDWFGRAAYLAQSPQFYKQQLVGVFERVYEVGPVFRAEPHATTRHLASYVSLDAEMGFIEDHFTVMEMTTRAVTGMIAAARALDLESTFPHLSIPEVPATIPHIHFTEAFDLISHATGEDVRSEPDLAPAHERWLGDWARHEHGSEWLFVTGYPMAKRPFYTHPQPGDARWSNSFDLLFRGLELVTGGQRLHRAGDYETALRARGEDPAAHAAYLQAFRHGMPPHGGFAIGLERWVSRLVEAANIREATLFPRDLHRLAP